MPARPAMTSAYALPVMCASDGDSEQQHAVSAPDMNELSLAMAAASASVTSAKQATTRSSVAGPRPVASPKAPPPRAARSSDEIQFRSPSPLSASPPLCSFPEGSQTTTPRRHNGHPAESFTPLSSAICRSQLAANRAQQLVLGQPGASTLYRQKASPVTDSNESKTELPHSLAVPSLAPKPGAGRGEEAEMTWCI